MRMNEVRSILKEYYNETERGLIYNYYEYKEEGALNCAFVLYENYSWTLDMSEDITNYGRHVKYSKSKIEITNEVYDSPDKLREKIYKMKNKYKMALSECKKYEIKKEFS